MRISNDGVFDSEPWEAYAETKSWTLTSGNGVKTVYVRFRSTSGGESDTITATIIFDTTAPLIKPLKIFPPMVLAGEPVHVLVDATDVAGVSSITANGLTLTKTGATTWGGDITGSSKLGINFIEILAVDILGYKARSSSYFYMVAAGIIGVPGGHLTDSILLPASQKYLLKMWGKVTVIDENSFYLDDGCGVPVKVISPGYSGIENGAFVSARGFFDARPYSKTLTCKPEHIVRYH
jgi:hypothetical protein